MSDELLTARAGLAPASILLRAYFHERFGTPLDGLTQFDIEAARVSFELDLEFAAMREGPTGMERYRAYLAERLAARRNAAGAKRHAAKLRRTPAWADPKAIKAIYAKAREMTATTGRPYHVDHEYPLQGRLVSGLHVAANLQILPGPENCRKNNRFEVEA